MNPRYELPTKKSQFSYHQKCPAGAITLHQILNSRQFNGAGSKVFRQFVDEIVKLSFGVTLQCAGRTLSHADFTSATA